MHDTPDTVLATDGLSRFFSSRCAVDNVSLRLQQGDIYGLLGGNGAGKSTLFKMLTGLIWPTTGTIRIFGVAMNPIEKAQLSHIGSVIEKPAFYEYLSARDNLEILCAYRSGSRGKIDHYLEMAGLGTRSDEKVRGFSHGMRQRLAIARALVADTDILILDEPFDGLDPIGIASIWKILLDLNRIEHMTILFSSHIIGIAERYCNRIGIMHRGKLIYEEVKEDLLAVSNASGATLEQIYIERVGHASSIDAENH